MTFLFRQVLRHPVLVLLAALAVTAFFAHRALGLRIHSSVRSYFIEGGEGLDDFDAFLAAFGSDETLIIAWTPARIDNRELERIERVARRLADNNGPHDRVDRVLCITRAADPVLTPGGEIGRRVLLGAGPLLNADLEAGLARFRGHPMYEGTVISRDQSVVAVVAVMDRSVETDDDPKFAVTKKARGIVREERRPGERWEIGGSPAFLVEFTETIGRELTFFIPLTFAVLMVVLLILRRRVLETLLPMGVVFLALIWTLGLINFLGYALTVSSTVMPVVILTIGVADVVHILSRYREDFHTGRPRPVLAAMGAVWLPCFITSVTTAVGFASLAVSGVRPIAEAGTFIAMGVMLAFLLAMTVVPASLALIARLGHGPPLPESAVLARRWFVGRVVRFSRRAVLARPRLVLLLGLAYAAAFLAFLPPRVEINLMDYFRADHAIVRAHRFLEERLTGAGRMEIVLRGTPEAFADPETWARISRLQDFLEKQDGVLGTRSYVDALGIAAAPILGGGDSGKKRQGRSRFIRALAALPAPARKLAGARVAGAMGTDVPEQLRALVGEGFSAVRISAATRDLPSGRLIPLCNHTREYLRKQVVGNGVSSGAVTGTAVLFTAMVDAVVESQVRSLALAVVVIMAMLGILFGSLRALLAALLPNLLPVGVMFGIMAMLDIPLNITTAMIASIAIGIAVDDTIHFLARYRMERRGGASHEAAVRVTLGSSGVAMVHTSVVLFFGFGVLVSSSFKPKVYLGVLTATTMVNALLGDLLLFPPMLAFFKPFASRARKSEALRIPAPPAMGEPPGLPEPDAD